ncbi:MAG TPA: FGGY-family carbohydrate kinase [Candidatus Limnocylindrales bacterium]|nr:FGGY-family carbohydrate kinase [Candidatus Limnocylindrales bacterium]
MSATSPAVLAIDAGTTELKTGLVGLDGTLHALARAPYPLDVDPSAGRAEQDPADWWNALVRAVRELAPADRDLEVIAIGIDGHGPTLAALDADGQATRPAIAWLDTRAGAEQTELSAATTLRGWSLGVLPAALWVVRHDSAAAARTRWWLNTWEALGFRLTGRAATTLVPGQPFPAAPVLAAAGLDGGRVAPTIPAGSPLGGLTRDAASALGLTPGTPVVAGMVDAFASFHGAGLVDPGDALDAGGAAGGFGVYWDSAVEAAGSFCTRAPLDGRYVVGGAMAATGKALDWFRTDILEGHVPMERLLEEAAAVPPGADGLVFLPYLAGERSPLWDPTARGAFAGLTLRHRRGHLARSILEAAALAIRHVAEPILAMGVRVTAMRVTGGPARSDTWNRLKADVTGFAVEVPQVLETAVVGSAVAAAAGVGAHPDLETAIRAMTRIDRRIEPDPETRATYDRLYAAYTALHPAIAPILRGLAP